MTLRLGFVGVGRWARKLADAFRACGAEIICHDRQTKPEGVHPADRPSLDGFGFWMPWASQLQSPAVDAMIVVAPPEATTAVALACAKAGKPVMATKPLFDHPKSIRAPFYVDFWRLWARAHKVPTKLEYRLSGRGPFRGFPGVFDYGPHVMAALLDHVTLTEPLELVATLPNSTDGDLFRMQIALQDNRRIELEFGNGAAEPKRVIWGAVETATCIGTQPKLEVMTSFCQSFLNDVSEGYVDTRLLELSRRGMEELRKIREMSKPSG